MTTARQVPGAAAINNYKAPIAVEEVGTLVGYLTTLTGVK
jgi:hypothetical protein